MNDGNGRDPYSSLLRIRTASPQEEWIRPYSWLPALPVDAAIATVSKAVPAKGTGEVFRSVIFFPGLFYLNYLKMYFLLNWSSKSENVPLDNIKNTVTLYARVETWPKRCHLNGLLHSRPFAERRTVRGLGEAIPVSALL